MQKGFKEVNLHGCVNGILAIPVIGESGNWFIGNEDTGVSAKGEQGPQGPKGESGEGGNAAELNQLQEEVAQIKSGFKYETVNYNNIIVAANGRAYMALKNTLPNGYKIWNISIFTNDTAVFGYYNNNTNNIIFYNSHYIENTINAVVNITYMIK